MIPTADIVATTTSPATTSATTSVSTSISAASTSSTSAAGVRRRSGRLQTAKADNNDYNDNKHDRRRTITGSFNDFIPGEMK
jgi:hypothetical protein